MKLNRRQFIATGTTTAATVAAATADGANDDVIEEVRRRKRFLSRPDGTPSDIEVAPSPAVTPFADRLYVPPVAIPLIDMTSHEAATDEVWWDTFAQEFREKRARLVQKAGIDIGDLPVPEAHQRFWEFRPVKFYVIRELEFGWAYHSDYCGGYQACLNAAETMTEKSYMPEGYPVAGGLPPSDAERPGLSWTWGFETIGLDKSDKIVRKLGSPGPTFHAEYGKPILVRRMNELPEIGPADGNARLRFALPSTTTHLHNAHTASESDGFPNDWINPSQYWDHHYGNFASGHDDREKLATLWYHDHRMDFTAANVYAGLDGFYFLFDEQDANDETKSDSWQLPSGEHDVPLIFHDLYFQLEQNGGEETAQLVFDGFNTDGILGDRFTVNRIIQPHLDVKARKYRFRLLNGGPSRFYEFILYDENGTRVDEDDGAFIVITGDGNFQPNPILVKSVYLGVAQRVDVVIDFSRFTGQRLYLVNQLEQINGRGPTERRLEPAGSDAMDVADFLDRNSVLRFDVGSDVVADPSRVPLLFREFPPIDLTEVKRERVWEFDYDGGLWTINGKTYDPERIDAGIEQDSAEIWTFRNTGNSWHHPIHSHFTEFMVLEVNGEPHYQATVQTDDIVDYANANGTGDEGYRRMQQEQAFPSTERLRRGISDKLGEILKKIETPTEGPPAEKLRSLDPNISQPEGMSEPLNIAEQNLLRAYQALSEELQNTIAAGLFEDIVFNGYADFSLWITLLSEIGLGDARLDSFMGGPRRDVALILPNWEVKVFMRWKDFLGRHVMHCHNVVHEDHAMMIRWEIVPRGEGFDTPKMQDQIAQMGRGVDPPRIPHVENHPRTAVQAVDDSDTPRRSLK